MNSQADKKILITAANGHTGLPAAKELLRLGFQVRAMVRNPQNPNALALKRMGAEIFVGDLEDYRDNKKALEGIDRAYFCPPFAKNTLFKTIAFIIAAEESAVEHVVYMSQWLLSQDHPSINTKEQWLGDQIVKMHRKVQYTFVNPGMFAFTYFFTVEMIAQLGIMPTSIKGKGLNPPPSEEDQGRVVAHILKDPAGHHGKTYRPTGPKIISQQDVADTFSKIFKRKVKILEISEKMLLKSLKSMGYPIYEYANIIYYLKDVEQNVMAYGGVTDVVKELTGREPEDFETIARRAVSKMPQANQNFPNKMKALFNFMKIAFTKTPDLTSFERQQHFPNFIHGMNQVIENESWIKLRTQTSYNVKNTSIKGQIDLLPSAAL
ncbi:NmrA family NAD(P)-binding protein [Muricauda sp. JGD-17]|uniref:NmrA family NAD(P)-binding protein n=1 Tax=Flagellimonas ochracea TaxID=2696472 RepID=A0A964WXE7_9FLAO|nr:NmrA family NAD(P)-binding protein [Allomuricauda ochracea]NAY91733.1 NmrA family NAD(P)-binding protein [Allomuricauda ochracea]